MILNDAAEHIAIARIGIGRQGCAVVGHARDLIARRKRPCNRCVRVIDIRSCAARRAQACRRVCADVHGKCLILPDGIQCAGGGWHANAKQHALVGIIPAAGAVCHRIPAGEELAGVFKRIALHGVVCIVGSAAREARQTAGGRAAVAVVRERDVDRRIDPLRGERRILGNRHRAVGVIDRVVRAGAPADENLVRRRRDRSSSVCLHLRLAVVAVCVVVLGRSARRLAETVGDRKVSHADPNGV